MGYQTFHLFLVKPHQQNLEQLAQNLNKEMEEIEEINDPIMPPRILQNVHGYFELASERGLESGLESKGEGTATRLDLCHQWDRETVAPVCFKTEDGDAEGKNFMQNLNFLFI